MNPEPPTSRFQYGASTAADRYAIRDAITVLLCVGATNDTATFLFWLFFSLARFRAVRCLRKKKTFLFDESSHAIEVNAEQFNRLTEIDNRLDFHNEFNQLQKAIASSEKRLNQLLIRRRKELEALLTPRQLPELNGKRRAKTLQAAKTHAEFMVQFASFLNAYSQAEDLKVYEGIPHAETTKLNDDDDQTVTIEFGGALFYAEAVPVESSVLERLRSAMVDYQSFRPYESEKLYRGDTPDFCVVWRDKIETHCVQIYLWGNELVYVSPNVEAKFDFGVPTRRLWLKFSAEILVKHREKFENEYDVIK